MGSDTLTREALEDACLMWIDAEKPDRGDVMALIGLLLRHLPPGGESTADERSELAFIFSRSIVEMKRSVYRESVYSKAADALRHADSVVVNAEHIDRNKPTGLKQSLYSTIASLFDIYLAVTRKERENA